MFLQKYKKFLKIKKLGDGWALKSIAEKLFYFYTLIVIIT
jgi:hypothetical protein